MGNVNDIYRVEQHFDINGVSGLVRRFYRQASSLGDADTLATEWRTLMLPLFQAVMSDLVAATVTKVYNLFHESDYVIASGLPAVGTLSGSELVSSFNAYGLECPSPDTRIRAGLMRIPGVVEGTIDDGELNASTLASLDDVCDGLSTTIEAGLDTYVPVLWTTGNARTEGSPLYVNAFAWVPTRHTTQSSRKN